jgi:iron uptake system component EfeO
MTRWARSTAVASAIHRERTHAVARIRNVAESTPRSARLVVNSSNSASNVSAGTYPLTCLRLIIAGLATIAPVIAVGGAVDADMHTTSSPTSSVAPAGTAAAAVAPVAMTVTASACEPNDLNVVSGQVTFSIHNASSRPLEWEILDGVMVVYERENIAPGLIQTLTTRLAPGDYAITCGLLGNPKGSLHVAALAGADGKPSQADLIGPLAEYRVYASYEIDALVDDTRRLADALKSGDLNLARASFSATHAHYARIAPIAVFFPDLDGAVDAGAGDHDGQPLDAASMGFHQLEWDLFAEAQPRDCRPLVDRLVADVVALQARFESASLTPAPTIAGAAEAMGAVTLEGIGDVVEPHAGAGLSDLEANVEGVRKIVDLFRPLIEKTDRPLVGALGEDFAILEAALARYKNADGAFGPSANIGAEDRRIIQDIVKKLSGEVALMRGALGLS